VGIAVSRTFDHDYHPAWCGIVAKMEIELIQSPAVLLVSISALVLILSNHWRVSLAALFLLYIGEFILVALTWSVTMSLAKLLAGWMAALILWMALAGFESQPKTRVNGADSSKPIVEKSTMSRSLFQLFASTLVILVVYSVLPILTERIPDLGFAQAFGSLLLISLGLLHLGLTTIPWRVVVGLLTMLAGFEILYSAVELSILLEGLLAAVNLGLALLGAYMIIAPAAEELV
jgi:hypothetical protein